MSLLLQTPGVHKHYEIQSRPQEGGDTHFLERFYGGPYAAFVHRRAKAIAVSFGLLLAASTWVWLRWPGLQPATEPFT